LATRQKHKKVFIEGIRKDQAWTRNNMDYKNPLVAALIMKKRNQFKLTRTIKSGLKVAVEEVITNLGIQEKVDEIVERMIAIDLIGGYYDYHDYFDRIRERYKKQKHLT
jgi:hypothetical protein